MEKLRAYLTGAGETQRSFAQRVGLSPSHLNEIISGRKRPSLDVAFAITRASAGQVPVEAWDMAAQGAEHPHDSSSHFNPEITHDTPETDAATDAA